MHLFHAATCFEQQVLIINQNYVEMHGQQNI